MNNAIQKNKMEMSDKVVILSEASHFQQDAIKRLQIIMKKMSDNIEQTEEACLISEFIKTTAEVAGYCTIIKKKAIDLNNYLL